MERGVNSSRRVSEAQWDILLNFLEANPCLRKGYNNSAKGRAETLNLWKKVSIQLNSEPSGTTKYPKQWAGYYSHFKNKMKTKVAVLNALGGNLSSTDLSDVEKRYLTIMGADSGKNAIGVTFSLLLNIPEASSKVKKECKENEETGNKVFADKLPSICKESDEQDCPPGTPATKIRASRKVSDAQWTIILDFLEANPILSRGCNNSRKGREESSRLWTQVTDQLNEEPTGTTKTPKEWASYVSNCKNKMKKRAADMYADAKARGSSPDSNELLETDRRFLTIMGWSKPYPKLQTPSKSSPTTEVKKEDLPRDDTDNEKPSSIKIETSVDQDSSSTMDMEACSSKWVSDAQWAILIDFLEANPNLVRKDKPKKKAESSELWGKIAKLLNKVRLGTRKDPKEWMAYVRYFKCKLKRRLSDVKMNTKAKGVSPQFDGRKFSQTELRFIRIMGPSFGLPSMDICKALVKVAPSPSTSEGETDCSIKREDDTDEEFNDNDSSFSKESSRNDSEYPPIGTYQKTHKKIVTEAQQNILLKFLGANQYLVRGYNNSARGRAKAFHLWQEVSVLLNKGDLGTSKTPKEWATYVSHYKNQIKRRLAAIKVKYGDTDVRDKMSVKAQKFMAVMGLCDGTDTPVVDDKPLKTLETCPRRTSPVITSTIIEIKQELLSENESENEQTPENDSENEQPTKNDIKNEQPTEIDIKNEQPTEIDIKIEQPTENDIKNEHPTENDSPSKSKNLSDCGITLVDFVGEKPPSFPKESNLDLNKLDDPLYTLGVLRQPGPVQCFYCQIRLDGDRFECTQCVCQLCTQCERRAEHSFHYLRRVPAGKAAVAQNQINDTNKRTAKTTVKGTKPKRLKRSEDKSHLSVAITLQPPAELNQEEGRKLEGILTKLIVDYPTGHSQIARLPSFLDTCLRSGVLCTRCEDDFSLEWLKKAVKNIPSPRPNTTFAVISQADILKKARIFIRKGHKVPFEIIQQCLIRQNITRCDLKKWTIYKHTDILEPFENSGKMLEFGVPDSDAKHLMRSGQRLNYGLGLVEVKFEDIEDCGDGVRDVDFDDHDSPSSVHPYSMVEVQLD